MQQALIAPAGDESAGLLDMLRDAAGSFARGELGPNVLRDWRGRQPPFDVNRWQAMAAMGWTGLLVPEAFGGSDAGLRAACAVLTELGQALPPEPVLACGVLAAVALRDADPGAVRTRLLQGVAAGDERPALAHEAPSSIQAAMHAHHEAGSWVLAGECRFIRPGRGATGWIVRAGTDAGEALFWLPAGDVPAQALQYEALTDGGDAAWLRLQRQTVDESQLLAGPGRASQVLRRAADATLIAIAAELLGVMRGAFAGTLEHLRTRRQFGAAIGSFQSLQHRAVDLHLQHELTSACVERAARRFDEGAQAHELSLLAAHAKARASDAALLTSRETTQFHGAMGYTDECDIGLYFKRSLSLSAWLGNAPQQRQRYAELRFAAAQIEEGSAQ